MTRRPQEGEQRDGDEDGVEAGNDRHARDLGVAHHLGDGQRGERHTSDDVHGDPRPVDREDPLHDGERATEDGELTTRDRLLTLLATVNDGHSILLHTS